MQRKKLTPHTVEKKTDKASAFFRFLNYIFFITLVVIDAQSPDFTVPEYWYLFILGAIFGSEEITQVMKILIKKG